MGWLAEVRPSNTPAEAPLVCPVCCDHEIERIEGIVLSAGATGGRELNQVSVYRCSHWHLFALIYSPAEWEESSEQQTDGLQFLFAKLPA
jgi:hypothetical protein